VKTVSVEIKGKERELEVVWYDPSPFPSYQINRKTVEYCAREIRRVLRELVDAALVNKLGLCGTTLKKLAEQGSLLHNALFSKTDDAGDPKRIRNYFDKLTEPYQLRFIVSDDIFVPWGLVYPRDSSELPEGFPENQLEVWEVYRSFWCLDHQLSTIYHRISPDAAGDASPLDMLRVVHPDALATAVATLAKCPEDDFLAWLNDFSGEPLTTYREFREAWRKRGPQIGLLYFYCHANKTKLALGNDEKIEASQLYLLLEQDRQLDSSGCLVLINGCSTAVGAAQGEFLQATSREGLCGFVGTETDVPDIFALRFSLSLLRLLFRKGLSLGEAMQCLYHEHFPLGLVYGLYALPDFRMRKEQAPDIVFDKPQNFSFGQVGTNRLEASCGI
jgi:hypothetical protein